MKKMKISLTVLAAIAVATLSAFSTRPKSTATVTAAGGPYWYANVYVVPGPGPDDLYSISSSTTVSAVCWVSGDICIEEWSGAPDAGYHPTGSFVNLVSYGHYHN